MSGSNKQDVVSVDTITRNNKQIFLTEFGLYKLAMISRKPLAIKFQKWICNVIKEICLTGEYKLKNQFTKEKHLIANDYKKHSVLRNRKLRE